MKHYIITTNKFDLEKVGVEECLSIEFLFDIFMQQNLKGIVRNVYEYIKILSHDSD